LGKRRRANAGGNYTPRPRYRTTYRRVIGVPSARDHHEGKALLAKLLKESPFAAE
jgi:hypothetical protein